VKTESDTPPQEHGESQNGGCICGNRPFFKFLLKPEHERRPGREVNKHLPEFWPAVPSAGHWGGTSWLDTHAKLVGYVQANRGPIDILLVGDSLTQQ
jgi:hypothetical protein